MPNNGDVTKLLENSQFLAEMPSKCRFKVVGLVKWLRSDLSASGAMGDENDVTFAARVLELNKMNMHRAQRFLIKYFKSRSNEGCEDIFHDRNAESEEILTSCQSVYMFTIPRLTDDGHRINFMRLVPGVSLENFDPRAFFKRFFMVSDIRFKEDTECKGDIFLIDLTGFTYSHVVKMFNSGLLNTFIKNLKDTYPRRTVAIHFMNVKSWHRRAITFALKISKAGKRVNKKIGYHSENEDSIEGFDTTTDRASQVFQDFNDIWTKKIISYCPWFESMEAAQRTFVPRKMKKYKEEKFEEKKKSEKTNVSNYSEVFTYLELDGAFRQMELDDTEEM